MLKKNTTTTRFEVLIQSIRNSKIDNKCAVSLWHNNAYDSTKSLWTKLLVCQVSRITTLEGNNNFTRLQFSNHIKGLLILELPGITSIRQRVTASRWKWTPNLIDYKATKFHMKSICHKTYTEIQHSGGNGVEYRIQSCNKFYWARASTWNSFLKFFPIKWRRRG